MTGNTRRPTLSSVAGPIALLTAVAIAPGCDISRMAANSSSYLIERAAPAFEQFWDYDLAGEAAPGNIIQLEGMLRIVPENEIILLQLVRAYVGYAYGWLEDRALRYEDEGRHDLAQRERDRARYLYLRARDLGMHLMRLHATGVDRALESDLEEFEAWLENEFDRREDAAILLWTGQAWGSYIQTALENLAVLEGLPYVRALVRRSVELDADYYHAAGLAFLATMAASERYADLDEAERLYREALERTERRALMILVNMARYYAVAKGDEELYVALLREVLEAGDTLPEARLANRIAKRRAARLIRRTDELFPEGGRPAGEEQEAPGEGSGAESAEEEAEEGLDALE